MNSIYIEIAGGVGADYVEDYDLACDQHYHRGYELYYLRSGERTYMIDNRLLSCRPGDVVLVRPEVLHGTTGSRYSRYVVNFDRDFLRAFFQPAAVARLTDCFSRGVLVRAGEETEAEFARMLADYRAGDRDAFALHLAETLLGLGKRMRESDSPADGAREVLPRISEIVRYIGVRYAEIENIEEIAEKFYFSKYYLCRIFKQYTGVPIGVYLLNLRIANASRMLAGADCPVSEIAERCGFHSTAHFCNTFRKHVGLSPSAYRKKSRL